MPLQPSSSTCYDLKLPALPAYAKTLDEAKKRNLTLDCRTGAAVNLSRSNIFTHGGLTIPLNIKYVNSINVQQELIIYFAKEKQFGISFKNLNEWISSEIFFLDLITRIWKRVPTTTEGWGKCHRVVPNAPFFKERLFHSMCYTNSFIYVFGGLIVSPDSGYELIASNCLWRLNLQTKVWSLLSEDPHVTRRFNHTMHVKNENDETRDTKLVIVGGLNNLDEPVETIDIYNATKNCWEFEINPEIQNHMYANVDGKRVSLTTNSNFSTLVENNEANIPALAFYYPQITDHRQDSEYKSSIDSTNSPAINSSTDSDELFNRKSTQNESFLSPYVALPLLPDSEGMRMDINIYQNRNQLKIPFNLKFPMGDCLGYNIISAGFYPDCSSSNFYCFSYDIHTGKWTRINIACPDADAAKHTHRFWKLLVWKSHHQTLLLGTKNDDANSPTVQKFDFLSTIYLPMVSMYNTLMAAHLNSNSLNVPHSPISFNEGEFPPTLLGLDRNNTLRKQSYTSTATSQFESYIRYIAPPIELTSMRSVFEPYAMVLGRDALEIFGASLSDFEFVTDEGDSIGVPIYLLRKRWGRYFDMLLSQGYAKACEEYETHGTQSTLIKYSPKMSPMIPKNGRHHSDISSLVSLNSFRSRSSSGGPLSTLNEATLQKNDDQTSVTKGGLLYDGGSSGNTALTNALENQQSSKPCNTDDEQDNTSSLMLKLNHKNSSGEGVNPKNIDSSTTSSTSGMIFRVPFQEQSTIITTNQLEDLPIIHQIKGSSSIATVDIDMVRKGLIDSQRRVSTPNSLKMLADNKRRKSLGDSSLYHHINSRKVLLTSRRASVASQGSSISFVSSSSDRMGSNMFDYSSKNGTNSSTNMGVLNIPLPPQMDPPMEPLPLLPNDKMLLSNRRASNSVIHHLTSASSSPGATRHPSLLRRLSMTEASNLFFDTSVISSDNQLVEDEDPNHLQVDVPMPQFRNSFAKSTASTTRSDSAVNLPIDDRKSSYCSTATGGSSVNSPFTPDFEPLLTPRTLYMPWSTSTVKAFTEFFYNGQVNAKWLLIPVVLNLLVMSKIYEIPLLYSLISEVLYSIAARKELSLVMTCTSLMEVLRTQALDICDGDEERVKQLLVASGNYRELTKLKKLLENINNGFLDVDSVIHSSRTFSSSTIGSSDTERRGRDPSFSSYGNNIPNIIRGGPKDGSSSLGSFSIPFQAQGQRLSSFALGGKAKKKSSLSKEIDNENGELYSELGTADDEIYSSGDFEEQLEQVRLRDLSALDNMYDANINNDESIQKKLEKLSLVKTRDVIDYSMSSSQSEPDELDSELGVLSLSKMKRKLGERDDDDESIDPLLKFHQSSSLSLPDSNKNPPILQSMFSSQGSAPNLKAYKDDMPPADLNVPTLENLLSPSCLPPVDYVMKAIYRTAVLTNDIKLMVRCLDCIDISSSLKAIKKNINIDLTNNSLLSGKSRNGVPNKNSIDHITQANVSVVMNSMWTNKSFSQCSSSGTQKARSISPRSSNINFRMTPSTQANDVSTRMKPSSTCNKLSQAQVPISPRTSVAEGIISTLSCNNSINLKRSNADIIINTASHTTTNPCKLTGNSNGTMSVSNINSTLLGTTLSSQTSAPTKGQKEHTGSNSSTFSFFSKKK